MSKKPRILYVATFPPPVHGSAMVSQYIKDSKLINEQFDGDYVNLSSSRSMDEIGKFKFVKLWRFASSYFILLWKLLTHHYDLCYCAITCRGTGFLKDAPYVLLCKMFGHKIIIHQHNKGMANYVDKWPYRWLLPMVYKNTKVILLSWRLYDDISRIVKKEQVVICPNGIPETFSEEPHFERNNAVPHILFLSNLMVDKGVLVLLDALKILKEKGYSFICDFVGGETKEIDAARFASEVESRGLNTIALYHGRKYGEEKAESFANADIFTLPSFNEALPLTILEAMENKLPVVSTDVGGICDEVKDGETGYISETRDSESLADSLGKLISDKELRTRMGEEGYKLLKEKFTMSAFESQLAEYLAVRGGVNLSFALAQYQGRKYGADKDAYYRNADLFVFPTLNEAFGLVNLEAMEYKLPVISSDEGGVPDIIKDGQNGFICEKRNAEMLAEKISTLLSDKDLRERMGEEGYKLFKGKFTMAAFEAQLLEILKVSRGGVNLRLDWVQYRGKRYGTLKEEFFSNADIFVFPTFYGSECFPLVLLEAMQHKLPIVTTDEGGIPDITDGGCGLIGNSQDVESIANRIAELLTDKSKRVEMGNIAYQKYCEQYTIHAFEKNLLDILRSNLR